jgi:hypothetical protein
MKSVNLLQSRYGAIPILDLKGKTKEINGLLDELARDSKRAIVRERSQREELLAEIINSMLNWLNDIWTVVYEYNVHFDEAHACLLFIADVLNTLNSVPGIGGCVLHLSAAGKSYRVCSSANADAQLLFSRSTSRFAEKAQDESSRILI